MKNLTTLSFVLFTFILLHLSVFAQKSNKKELNNMDLLSNGLKFRNIGPAFMSGRVADIAIHPKDNNTWYIAVGSGGVWKTMNAGTTWKPIFDKESSYSIGCITIDQENTNRIWVGTGENVGGRHVGYGDGIYKSENGGLTWQNMGLKKSEHISKIIVHPDNSNVIYVAAQGPLWSKGGERGFYFSDNGGLTWHKTLGDDWTGVTDIEIDPNDPEIIYAAAWQRHRNVAAYMGGGPGTALYKSKDGGRTWTKLKTGLPTKNMGKIGLALSPHDSNILYAAIELERRTGAVYKSTDQGISWTKQSNTVSGATGPHYYQELYACPHQKDRIYLMDVRVQVSNDGGKTFKRLNEKHKHSDNHAMAFRMDDPDYMLMGTDGGLYETYDEARNWRFMDNLPLTQFYKLAVDDQKPFYNIYGGTQDNSTQMGPSRTMRKQGIINADWKVVLGGDGHQPATEPGNPNILYAQSQEGQLHRVDLITGEKTYIKPQPLENGPYERNNWDSPVLVSPHAPNRIYFASQHLWKSNNRGDSWEQISPDLTRNEERLTLTIMDQTWSWDSPWDVYAMSNYNSITSIAESPVQADLLYVGTDDGLIQISSNGGKTWNKIEVGSLPGIPATAFVNDIKADLFDANTAYLVLDNHKYGDLQPYLLKTSDQGKTWKSIRSNLPDRTLVWRIVQDHKKEDLMFLATEFGIYFTINGGDNWLKFKAGLPTISFRDLQIQKDEDDLVAASFGRGFFVLDDYSILRTIDGERLEEEAFVHLPKHTWYFREKTDFGNSNKGSQGADFFTSPNPLFGAVFTIYLKDKYTDLISKRKDNEKKAIEDKTAIEFPGWDNLEAELTSDQPQLYLYIEDSESNFVNKLKVRNAKGSQRVNWNLKGLYQRWVGTDNPVRSISSGPMVLPGTYQVSLVLINNGEIRTLCEKQSFELTPLQSGVLPEQSLSETLAFYNRLQEFDIKLNKVERKFKKTENEIRTISVAALQSSDPSGELLKSIQDVKDSLALIKVKTKGYQTKKQVGEKNNPTVYSRYWIAKKAYNSSYGPTEMHKENLLLAEKKLAEITIQIESAKSKTDLIRKSMTESKALIIID